MDRSVAVGEDERSPGGSGCALDRLCERRGGRLGIGGACAGHPRGSVKYGRADRTACVLESDERIVDVFSAWGAAPRDERSRISDRERFGFLGRVLESGRAAVEPIDPDTNGSIGTAASGARLKHAAGGRGTPSGRPSWRVVRRVLRASARPGGHAVDAPAQRERRGVVRARARGLGGLARGRADRRVDGMPDLRRDPPRAFARDLALGASRPARDVLLRGGLRVGDTLGRYGADEIVAILPDTDLVAASVVAKRLWSRIATIMAGGQDEPLGASVGVAQDGRGDACSGRRCAAAREGHRGRKSARADDVAAGAGRDVITVRNGASRTARPKSAGPSHAPAQTERR
jgi:hypothetical protein